MNRYLSGRQQNLKVGISSYTDTETVLEVIGKTTSYEFIGGGSGLKNLSGTHIVSYASASDISNSALSISGVSTHSQVGILTGAPYAGDSGDFFGRSVATSADGKTIVVGASNDEVGAAITTGVVYIYDRNGNSFNQVGVLTGSLAGDEGDVFGWSVATSADGKTIVVGALRDEAVAGINTDQGLAYVFDRVGNTFNQVGILAPNYWSNSNDGIGISVATSADGKTIIVGAYQANPAPGLAGGIGNTNTGAAYVYDRVGNSFNQVGFLTGSFATSTNDSFGWSVATSADGKTIVVGAPQDEISTPLDTGVAYVFDRVGVSSFSQVGILTGTYATNTDDQFGQSVAISADGKTIVVGAPSDEAVGAAITSGVAYVYDRVGVTSFNQVGILTGTYASAFGADDIDFFGFSVATSANGKTIVVGARNDEIGATNAYGIAYVYKREDSVFNQVSILSGSLAKNAGDFFAWSVAISADGKNIVVGAPGDELSGSTGYGLAYVFDEVRSTYVYSGPTGNIGIGTSTPTSKLSIIGDVSVSGVVTSTNGFTSGIGTAVKITTVGNKIFFSVVGVGTTSFTLF
jgi:glutamate synthase domain-containing protein 3